MRVRAYHERLTANSQPAIDGPWYFDELTGFIQHEASDCPTCEAFVQHYNAADVEEQSFLDACAARDDIAGSVEDLRWERDQALNEVAALQRKVAEGLEALKEVQEALRAAEGINTSAPRSGTPEELTGDSVGLWFVSGPSTPACR